MSKKILFLKKIKNSPSCIFFIILLLISTLVTTIPVFSLSLGDVFFGGEPKLYNVKIANFLYKQSTDSILPLKSPRYAHHQLSRTYFIMGDLNNALDEAKKELELYPDDTSTYYILGLTYGYVNRTHEAIDAFSRYIDTHPETWAGRNDKAWLQFRIGDIDGALTTIEPAAKQYPHTAWVQNTYCTLLLNKKRYKEAKIACNSAKITVYKMTEKDWGHAYPGNDPRIYEIGLHELRKSIENNIELLNKLSK